MKLNKGDVIETLALPSTQGDTFDIKDLAGKKAIVTFYRFATCPFCNLRINEFTKRYGELGDNFQVIAIFDSPLDFLIKSTKNEDRIIIDDIRYPNELETLKKNGFTIIKLVIDNKTQEERIMSTYPETYEQHLNNRNHKSEIYIDSMKADYEIISDGNVIENILKSIDPYYGKSLPSTATISSSSFS